MRNYNGTPSDQISDREIRHQKLARRAAAEGMVLLENRGILPLKAGSSLAVYGGGALFTVKGGTGSGAVNNRNNVSILEGLRNAGFRIVNSEWLSDYQMRYEKAYREWVS